jgi:uncharacterized membrane protein
MVRTEQFIEIEAPVGRVFDLFSDFEALPRWMENVRRVEPRGRRYTRWVADTPPGASVEWDAETVAFDQDRRIAWRSVGGDLATFGEAVFDAVRPGVTLMRVRLAYDPPAGRLGAVVARLLGEDPARQLAADLRRFRRIAETLPGARGDERRERPARARREVDARGAERRRHAPPLGPPPGRRDRADEAEALMRRGVDRLLDEAPSRRWRR